MNKSFCTRIVSLIVLVMVVACRPAPQPEPPVSPTVPASPTAIIAPTVTATRAPTASPVPTLVPTVAPTTASVATPIVTPTVAPTVAPTAQPTSTPTTAPTVQPPPQPTAIPVTPDASGAVLDLFNRTNALRAANGLAAYRLVNRLNAAAQRHSDDMANANNISHTGSDGSNVKQRVLDTGYGDWPVAENIFGGVATVDDTWDFWTTEPAHRDGLLSSQFRDVGISVVKGKGGTFYYTMVFGARPPQAIDPTATPAPTLVAVVPVPPTATPNLALDANMDLFNRTNALRAQNGLPPYRLSDKLNASAERHSQDMANTANIDHTGSDGSTAKQRILDTGYEPQFTGEDIYGGVATVDDAWDYWSNDPPHRATLLNQLYTDIGISVVKGQRGTFYYTLDLARPTPP
jgi:uncharacterized protein YkwD